MSVVNEIAEQVEGKLMQRFFIQFINLRFPCEECRAYLLEWKDRFNSGNPESRMDFESRRIYVKIINDYLKKVV